MSEGEDGIISLSGRESPDTERIFAAEVTAGLALRLISGENVPEPGEQVTAKAYAGVVAEGLQSPSPAERAAALKALANVDCGAAIAHAGRITPLLDDVDARVRSGALSALSSCGPEVAGYHEAVAHLLGDDPLRPGPHHPEAWGAATQAPGRQWPLHGRVLGGDPSEEVRHAAAYTLKEMGPAAVKTHIHTLGACLHDESEQVAIAALDALASLGLEGTELAADAAALLRHRHAEVRAAASKALQSMGEAGAINAAARLTDREQYVCDAAGETLLQMGALGAKQAAELLKVQDGIVTRVAVNALAPMGTVGADAVIPLLKDERDHVKMGALLTLGRLGSAGAARSKEIAALFFDKNNRVAQNAAKTLGRLSAGNDDIGTSLSSSVAKVLCSANGVRDPRGDVRRCCVLALLGLGGPGKRQAHALLTNWDKHVRSAAAEVFGRGGLSGAQLEPEQVTALAELLGDPEVIVRGSAVMALQRLGTMGADASALHLSSKNAVNRTCALEVLNFHGAACAQHVETIMKCLTDEHVPCRAVAAILLGAFRDQMPSISAALITSLNDPDPGVRRATCVGLAKLLGDSHATVEHADAIAKLLKDKRCECQAAAALGQFGKIGAAYIGEVAKMLDHTLARDRVISITAIGRWANHVPAEPQYAHRIAQMLQRDADDDVRLAAAQALGPMRPASAQYAAVLKKAVSADGLIATTISIRAKAAASLGLIGDAPTLVELLQDSQGDVRAAACDGLASMKASQYVGAIEPLRMDPENTVRAAAEHALSQILGPGLRRPPAVLAAAAAAATTDKGAEVAAMAAAAVREKMFGLA